MLANSRNRRRVTGRTNLGASTAVEQETKASLERKRAAKERQRRDSSTNAQSGAKAEDDEVVSRLMVDLRERFYDKGSLAKSFRGLDEDLSGGISIDEFRTFFNNMGHSLSDSQVHLLLERVDSDKGGTVDLDEFCTHFDLMTAPPEEQGFSNVNTAIGEVGGEAASTNKDGGAGNSKMEADDHTHDHDDVIVRVHSIISQLKRKVAQKGSMRTVFREYDANHDGSISRDEFRDALNNLNLRVTDEELDALLSMVDSHHTDNQEIMYDDFCAKFGDEQQAGGLADLGVHTLPDFTSAKDKASRLTPKLTELAKKLQSGSGLVCFHKILKAFKDFDTDGTGMISRDHFRFAVDRVSRLGATTGASDCVVGWEHEVDTKGGGSVDYVAFVERLRQAGVSQPANFFFGAAPKGVRDTRARMQGEVGAMNEGNATPADGSGAEQEQETSPAWHKSPMHRPTRFEKSAKLRYKNTSYITCPEEGSPSFYGSSDRFRTTRQVGLVHGGFGQVGGGGKHIPEAKAERIRSNQRRIEAALREEAARKQQQETARIDSLSNQRQNYLDRVNQASSIGQPRGVRSGTQVGVSQTNILTGLTH